MDQLLEVLGSYIREGRVTVMSQAGDGIDSVASAGGLTWGKVAMKTFQANACLYLGKGMAEHMMFQDVDEFFIPAVGVASIPAAIAAAQASKELTPLSAGADTSDAAQRWRGGRGLADSDGHPYCYLTGSSRVVLNRQHGTDGASDNFKPFLGDRFLHGTEPANSKVARQLGNNRVIYPTRRVFHAGLAVAGLCMLPPAFTDCKKEPPAGSFCGDNSSDGRRFTRRTVDGAMVDFRTTHNFFDMTTVADAKQLDPALQGSYYHFLLHKKDVSASTDALYSTR